MKTVLQSLQTFKDKHLVSLRYAWGHKVHQRLCLGEQVQHWFTMLTMVFSTHILCIIDCARESKFNTSLQCWQWFFPHKVHHRLCLGEQVEHKCSQLWQWFSPHSSDLTKQTMWRKSLVVGLIWAGLDVQCTIAHSADQTSLVFQSMWTISCQHLVQSVIIIDYQYMLYSKV